MKGEEDETFTLFPNEVDVKKRRVKMKRRINKGFGRGK
jgi:hypothetical protein